MKQLLHLSCLALSIAFTGSVSAATLYALDFNTLGPEGSGGIAFSNSGSGTTPIAATGGYNNYNGASKDSSAYSHSPHGGTFSIKDSGGIGANTSDGFTIELDFRQSGSNWADLFSFAVGGYALKFEKAGNTGGFRFYDDALTPGGTKTSSTLNNFIIPFTLSANTWTTMSIDFQELTAGTTTLAFYKDGSLVGSTTSTELVGNLTEVRGKANVANVDAGDNWLMDNFTLTSVPEPCSIALLGLGGLTLILRRRK
ncbi:MAG: PEP-CTERM sorting domain-containing protein [Luteolibacter sp.]